MSDVTAVIVFHGEGLLAQASITSFTRCCDVAAAAGVTVIRMALLDDPDDVTREALLAARGAFDDLEIVHHSDLGATRNAGVARSDTTYVTFFDGDDLWGEQWLLRAHLLAEESGGGNAAYHPRALLRFVADDHRIQSPSATPPAGARSHFFIHVDSDSLAFDPRSLVFRNAWSANAFAARSIFERFPYVTLDTRHGFGFEDWIWNLETLVNGVRHVVVPDTVHCIRTRPETSLGNQVAKAGYVPPIHRYAGRLEEAWRAKVAASSQPLSPGL